MAARKRDARPTPKPVPRRAAQKSRAPHDQARDQLARHALSKPGAWEDHPWGETAIKVGKKMFCVLGRPAEALSVTCKLPASSEMAVTMFSFAAPTGYGLGASGWVTATFAADTEVPVQLLCAWIDESFEAIAPRRERRATAGRAAVPAPRRRR